MNKNSEWYKRMMEKYGSDEAISAVMRENANKSRRNKGGKGGFAALAETDPERHKQLSSQGGKHRNEYNDPDPDEQSVHQPGPSDLSNTAGDRT